MPKQPKVAEIFEYYPEGINLIGFPKVAVIDALGRRLGREVILERHQTEVRGRKFVYPSFPPEFAEKRQAFFRRLKSSNWVQRTFFDSGIPDIRDLGRYRTYEDFFGLCGQVYSTLKTARTQLRPFKHLPEAKRVLRRVDGFDSKLEEMLKTLEKIEESKTFALDVKNGEIAFIPEMPEDKISLAEGSRALGLGGAVHNIKLKMKKEVLKMANEVGLEFQRNIFNYVRKEFKFSKLGNLRRDFEQLAFPARLHSEYSDFLEFSAEYDTELVRDDLSEYCEEDTDVAIAFVRALDETSKKKGKFINNPICAKFSNHYNIRGLFPPTLMEDSEIRKPFIPIDFRTKPSETKILMAGLHSGCKTFYLDNLVAASIIGQTGESLIAESLTVPKYNRIFYYKSTDSGNGGKCETELIQVNSIISRAQKGDLLVIDEFLDSAQAEIANTIGPAILDRLLGSKATVIVTSHRCTDYDSLAEKGWTIMTPDYEIREERVIPLKRLVRGLPNQKVNMQYIQGRFNDIFN